MMPWMASKVSNHEIMIAGRIRKAKEDPIRSSNYILYLIFLFLFWSCVFVFSRFCSVFVCDFSVSAALVLVADFFLRT